MSRRENPLKVRRSTQRVHLDEPAMRPSCLLCRILSPIIVQHRHLLFNGIAETKTLLVNKGDSRNIECQWMLLPLFYFNPCP